MPKYDNTSTEDLLQKRLDLDEKIQALRDEKRELARVIDERLLSEAAKAKIENLTNPERAALLQTLQAEGIESEESVNGV